MKAKGLVTPWYILLLNSGALPTRHHIDLRSLLPSCYNPLDSVSARAANAGG